MNPKLPDPRNASLVVHVGGKLVPRADAKVSVFDSSVQGGDAVWEGLRVYDGRVFKLDAHLDRLFASAKAMAFVGVPTRVAVERAIFETLAANGMRDGAHIRLTLTRGEKVTSGMSTKNNQSGCCLIVLAEWKAPVYDKRGIRLVTSSWRRNSPQCIDSKIHHNNLINNILAKIEAENAGVDDALMLDVDGFLSETNATNVFLVRRGELHTPTADSCLPGITRATVLELSRGAGIPTFERRISLSEVYAADEMFTTGTMGELAAVVECDKRVIGDGRSWPLTTRLTELFAASTKTEGTRLPS
ncbi:MAG: aminotransferase class IV [Planctomycetes bacterium]|nr:aminotransferase class IV [Planctomycetota bacterium]